MIVIGTITEFINVLRVNARVIDVETGVIWSAAAITFPYHIQLKSGRSYHLNH